MLSVRFRRFVDSKPMTMACLFALLFACMDSRDSFAQRDGAIENSGAESLELKTKDGVSLHCEFYEGKPCNQTVPVMLIHGLNGQAGEWMATAKALQSAGFSVIVPDLRGHGESTEQANPKGGAARKLRASRLRPDDYKRMVTMDLEAVKKVLVKKHNQEELNIDMLTVVGSEFGAVIGSLWTAQDWSWPLVAGQRQGQDVKAVVMLSPSKDYKGVSIVPALKSRAFKSIATFVVYGEDGQQGNATRRLYKLIERAQMGSSENRTFEWGISTNLQGVKLLQQRKLGVANAIVKFVEAQVVSRAEECPYKARTVGN